MKFITERSRILESATSFANAMKKPYWASAVWTMEQKQAILDKLLSMDLSTATSEEVNLVTEIAYIQHIQCDECGNTSWNLVQLGEEPDYYSNTSTICYNCIADAHDQMRIMAGID